MIWIYTLLKNMWKAWGCRGVTILLITEISILLCWMETTCLTERSIVTIQKANYYVDVKMRAFMDPEQMEWLKRDLESTEKRCIIFSHQSIDTFMRNGDEVRQILEDENRRAGFKKWY